MSPLEKGTSEAEGFIIKYFLKIIQETLSPSGTSLLQREDLFENEF